MSWTTKLPRMLNTGVVSLGETCERKETILVLDGPTPGGVVCLVGGEEREEDDEEGGVGNGAACHGGGEKLLSKDGITALLYLYPLYQECWVFTGLDGQF